ncbi:efflux RND transporter permease subunit [Macrococcus hajekii]|uniref:Efflux RND transporter permease subunit n=1 Tax=Macrococcus hajekii TaxID=198482 RepID=A0A4R6BJY2_9STAP|nr:efflux RND transporter permease subunit [Macrococcus hajekii]TDM01861.1 efflux RND transporter permease subunit [Macrococcus hajekii]GGB08115.1 multidrug transporter [Macrococcus hajekii]
MVKKIIDFSLHNKLALWLMTLLLAAAGIYSAMTMKMEMLPSISSPVLTVTTPYPGATPEAVLDNVTDPIEKKVKSMEGVDTVSSQSMQNASAITLQYEFGTDMDKAEKDVQEAIDALDLPEEVKDTNIDQISMYTFPIISYSFSNDVNDLKSLTQKIKDDLLPQLEGVEGVSSVSFSGQEVEQVELQFDEDKLKKEGLTQESVLQFIKGATTNAPLGLYTFGNDLKSIIVDGQFTSVDALKSLKIPATGSASGAQTPGQQPGAQMDSAAMAEKMKNAKVPTVTLGDVATIKNVQSRESISKTNGNDSLSIQLVKTDNANTVSVANDAKKIVDQYVNENKDIHALLMMDQAKPIQDSVKTMVEKAVIGAIFAVVMILVFLRNIRSTFIAVVSIPMSILIALLILKQLGVTLNIMTLGAMTVAIGRVIDDSIVVIENIFRRMSSKSEPLRGTALIADATREMFIPIMSSTMVTIAVFLPLGLVSGSIGELFRPFALTVVFALLASLLIAITIVPMLGHIFFRNGIKGHHDEKPGRIAHFYRNILEWSLNHKWLIALLSTLLLVGSLMLTPLVGTSFISTGEDKLLALTYKPEPGETEEEVVAHGDEIQKALSDNKYVNNIQYSVGGKNPFSPVASNDMAMMVEYDKDTPNWDDEAEKVLDKVATYKHPGTWKNQDFATGGASNTVAVSVVGPSTEAIRSTVKEVENVMKKQKALSNISSSLSKNYEEYTIKVDQNKLAENGLTAGQVSMALNQYSPETVVTKIGKAGQSTDVILTKEQETNWTEAKLKDTTLTSPMGRDIKLSDVASIEKGQSSDTISRKDGDVSATVDGKIKADDVGKTTADVSQAINKIDKPNNVKVNVGGTSEDIGESFSQLGLAMLAAIGIVYLILVLTFKGGLAPLAILFSLPFTIIGVIVGLLLSGETLSVPSMIGVLMLIGIVVTNAIVLIDRVIHMEDRGLSTREALLEAAATRVRPILMTALATVGALSPLLFGGDGSVLISKALGVTVIGGLVSSTLLTLIVVPVVYETLMKIKNRRRRKVTEVR